MGCYIEYLMVKRVRKVEFTETVLRDANQSLIATRMQLDQFESILSTMDQVGYYSVECWGGATFDSCLRYLDEDPWQRLKIIKKHMPNTKLQMLLRGQNLVGYKHYSNDVVRKFIYNAISKGIDIIRIFDALNDIDNILVAVDETIRCGAHPSCAISYTVSPIHTIKKYVELAINMQRIGAQSICIKDMAGLLTAKNAYELISALKKEISVPIILHSHCTTGMAYMSYLKAVEAGVDVLDTAISSFSGGTSQPATEVMLKTISEYGYETGLNNEKVEVVNEHFRKVFNTYVEQGSIDIKIMSADPRILENQIPGGMYTNIVSQMKNQNIYETFDEVLEEIPKVRKELGYPPLVTPISQMIVTQSILNVLSGERYKTVINEIKAYVNGEYGKPDGCIDKNLMMQLVGKTEIPSVNHFDLLPAQYEEFKIKNKGKNYGRSEILSNILFPELIGNSDKNKDNLKGQDTFTYSIKVISKEGYKKKINITAEVSDKVKAVIMVAIAKNYNISINLMKDVKIYKLVGGY